MRTKLQRRCAIERTIEVTVATQNDAVASDVPGTASDLPVFVSDRQGSAAAVASSVASSSVRMVQA